MTALLTGLALWPLHGLAAGGFGGPFSEPPVERAQPKPKPKPKPQPRPKRPVEPAPRWPSKPKPAAGPAPATGQGTPAPVDQGRRRGLPAVSTGPMVRIPAGCFQMGSPEGEMDRREEERRHRVCVKEFELGRHEVTVAEFRRFVSATGYRTDAERNVGDNVGCNAFDPDDKGHPWAWRAWADWRRPNREQQNQDDHPVSCVSWNDAMAYIDWLNRTAGGGWRLPTEAEWEYAARAGTQTAYYWGDGETAACRYANVENRRYWTEGFPCDDGYRFVAPVGRFEANVWGLKDMLGNLWEWTCSAYDAGYAGVERECPSNNDASWRRVLRGGSWDNNPRDLRSADRGRNDTGFRSSSLGFRVARTLTP